MTHTNNNDKTYINADGQRVMRVTEVIRKLSKDSIPFWANSLGFRGISYKKELDRTANIGSMGHDVIEHFITPGKLAIMDYEAYDISEAYDRIQANRMIHSIIKWIKSMRKKNKFEVIATEKVVVGKMLGGTIDCIIKGWDDPDKVIFVDWKSSGFYLSQFLQLAGYIIIYEELHGENTVEGVMVVASDKKTGEKAEAMYMPRKKMKPILHMFQSLFKTAYFDKVLEPVFPEMLTKIE